MEAPKVYFEVQIHGEYFAQDGQDRVLRGYEATFKVPNAEKSLSVIVGKLLMPFLQRTDPQALAVYTHVVDAISCHGRKLDPTEIPPRLQSREQLRGYIKFYKLPIDVDEYGELGLLRDHIRQAQEDPDNFERVAAKYTKRKAEDRALFELNEDTAGVTNKPIPVKDGGADLTQPKEPKKRIRKKGKGQQVVTSEPKDTPKTDKPEDMLS